MPELTLHFQIAGGTDLVRAAGLVQESVAAIPGAKDVSAAPEEPRIGAPEIQAMVAATVTVLGEVKTVAEAGTGAVGSVTMFLIALKHLKKRLAAHGVEQVSVDVGPRKVEVDELTDEDEAELEEAAEDLLA